jgi:hypothetical protein
MAAHETGKTPETAFLRFTCQTAAQWLSQALRKEYHTVPAGVVLAAAAIPELTTWRTKNGRGWQWKGNDVSDSEQGDFVQTVPSSPRLPLPGMPTE